MQAPLPSMPSGEAGLPTTRVPASNCASAARPDEKMDYAVVMIAPPLHRVRTPLLLLALLWFALTTMPRTSHATEEPQYTVLRTFGKTELRQYAPYVVAEVVLKVSAQEAGGQAFPILAGYIFGKNKGQKKFEMTAPVTQSAAADGGTLVQFVLPKGVTLESAPEPLDPRVRLRLVPATQWAVIRYSGRWSQENDDEHLGLLRATLAQEGVATQGEPVLARYNAPFTPWFLRRNEIWLALR